jgi:hypothetical protein
MESFSGRFNNVEGPYALLMIKKTFLLLSLCLVFFIILQGIEGMTHVALTWEYPAPPIIVVMINLILQGGAIFLISFLILRKKKYKYDKKYWISSLLIVLTIHAMSNTNFSYSHNFAAHSIYIVVMLLVGLFSIFLSTRVRTEKR